MSVNPIQCHLQNSWAYLQIRKKIWFTKKKGCFIFYVTKLTSTKLKNPSLIAFFTTIFLLTWPWIDKWLEPFFFSSFILIQEVALKMTYPWFVFITRKFFCWNKSPFSYKHIFSSKWRFFSFLVIHSFRIFLWFGVSDNHHNTSKKYKSKEWKKNYVMIKSMSIQNDVQG